MEFTFLSAAEYRALDRDALEKRRAEVISMLDAETLPEGVTDEQMFAEADLVKAEIERRNKANAYRAMKLDAVAAGAGTVVAQSEPTPAPATQQRGSVSSVTDEDANYLETIEYRKALAEFVAYRRALPQDVATRAARAIQLRAAGDPVAVSFADGYTNMTDPTFANTVSTSPVIPFTISDQIISERKESGILYPLANATYYPGGVAIPMSDFDLEGHWITDKQVSPYQYDTDVTSITFSYFEYEIRIARTMLADALLKPNYKALVAEKFNYAWGRDMDAVMLNGTGQGQPLGILKDPRVIDQTAGAGTGKALVVEATKEDLASWSWWVKLLFNPAFNRLYRGDGSWVIADSTFGTYVQTLKDDVNRPLVQLNLQSGDNLPSIRGNAIHTVTPNLLPDFDTASVGDVVAVFGNMKNYTFNFQPGMPLSTRQWTDPETNTVKTALLAVVDGKVVDNNGFVIIKKKASA